MERPVARDVHEEDACREPGRVADDRKRPVRVEGPASAAPVALAPGAHNTTLVIDESVKASEVWLQGEPGAKLLVKGDVPLLIVRPGAPPTAPMACFSVFTKFIISL